MTFEWKQFKQVADHLKKQGDQGMCPEACYRSAVSRYYYSAFCHARNYARDGINQYIPRFHPSYKGEDHGRLIEHFQKVSAHINIPHANLARLLNLRRDADYQDEVDNLNIMADHAGKLAQRILEALP